MRKKIAVVFGGRSVEHDISLMSAKNVWESLDPEKYEKIALAITKNGCWMDPEDSVRYLYGEIEAKESIQILDPKVLQALYQADIAFPVLHGPYCEDGTLQGFFETLNIPYVAASHMACAASMDKTLAKQIFVANGLPTAPFLFFTDKEWEGETTILEIEKALPYPLFVKPAYLGSSVGISRVENRKELYTAIEHAFDFCNKVLIEKEIKARELEFPVIGNKEITVYPPGEILKGDDFYHFEGKYGENAMKVTPQAELDHETLERGKELSLKAYKALGCEVYARFDFFLDKENQWWISEVNTIPGFTKFSLLPQITNLHGLPMPKLLDKLISLAVDD